MSGVAQRDCFQLSCPEGAKRDQALQEVKQATIATLAAGSNVVVHCQAGVHRAPILMGVLLAWLRRTTFDEECDRLERMRAIDRRGVLSRRGGEALFAWACSSCTGSLPQLPRYPVIFICSAKGGLMACGARGRPVVPMETGVSGVSRRYPPCYVGARGAIGYDRQICKSCQAVLPGPDRRALS